MKALYTQLKAKLETIKIKRESLTKPLNVYFYNNQLSANEYDEAEQVKYKPLIYPCVLIQFPEDNPQVAAGSGAKTLDVLVRFHIAFVSYNFEPLEMFDIARAVEFMAEGFSFTDDHTACTPLTYRAQRVCHDYTNITVYQYDYATNYRDNVKYIYKDAIEQMGVTLNLTTNVESN